MFLHDGLDWWVEKVVKRHGRGEACLLRYADEFVGAFEDPAEAARVYQGLGPRLEQCGRDRSGAKTRIIPCSRHRRAGHTRFECLGCEFRWGKDRQGQDHLQRRTARKTLRPALTRFTAWGKAKRHLRWPGLCTRLHATLRGDDHDDGGHGNAASRKAFFNSAIRLLRKWLNRRRPRHRYPWPGYKAVLERFTVARPRIVGRPQTRQATLKTSADLRKRVFRKSPVRDNRTPGSVRGSSGHRRSYRDERAKHLSSHY
jgi:RNA-directed DNA polymerase